MSSGLATITAVALYTIVLAPLAVAYRRPRAAAPAALLYGALLLGVGFYHSGIFSPVPALEDDLVRSKTAAAPPTGVDVPTAKCAEALALADSAGLILDRSDPARLVVDESLWSSLPALARQVLTVCFEDANTSTSDPPVEVVPRRK